LSDRDDLQALRRLAELEAKAQGHPTPSQRRGQETGGDASMRGYNPPARNLMSSVAHGGLDAAGGVAQIVGRAAEAMGLPPGSDYPFVASPEIVDAKLAEARGQVNRGLGQPNPGGLDLMRGLSSSALVTPAMGAVGTAPTMLGRAAQAGRAGAIQGAAQPVTDAQSPMDFAKTKALQIGTGTVFGGGAQPALEMGAHGISALANAAASRARGAVQDTSQTAASLLAAQVLAQQGVKFNTLEKGVQDSIVKDVQEALKKYGGVNAAALGRQADFKALDIDPLKPWVTRDPVEWGQYKNLEMAKDAGEPLIRAKAELDRKLIGRLENLRGPQAGDSYQAGQVASNSLARTHKLAKDTITGLYDDFHRLAPDVTLDGTRLSSEAFKALDAERSMRFLSPTLKAEMDDLALGKTPATPSVLYQLQKVANREARKGGNEGYSAGIVSRAIDDEMDRFASEFKIVGPEMEQAARALKAARGAHKSLKMKEEAIPALRDVAEGKFAAEDFFNRYILGADVKEVAAMWSSVGSPELKQAARSQLVDFLKKKAGGAGSEDAAVFRQGGFSEALDSPGMNQKIKIMLGERGYEEVRRVQRAGEAAGRTPAGSRFNTSGTAAEMMNLLKRSSGIPAIGPMVSDPIQKLLTQGQAAGMQQTGPSAIGAGVMDPFFEELLRRARQGSGLLSPAIGGSAAGELTR
jgi:hypothetical protein